MAQQGHQFDLANTCIVAGDATKGGRLLKEAWFSDSNSINRHVDLHPAQQALRKWESSHHPMNQKWLNQHLQHPRRGTAPPRQEQLQKIAIDNRHLDDTPLPRNQRRPAQRKEFLPQRVDTDAPTTYPPLIEEERAHQLGDPDILQWCRDKPKSPMGGRDGGNNDTGMPNKPDGGILELDTALGGEGKHPAKKGGGGRHDMATRSRSKREECLHKIVIDSRRLNGTPSSRDQRQPTQPKELLSQHTNADALTTYSPLIKDDPGTSQQCQDKPKPPAGGDGSNNDTGTFDKLEDKTLGFATVFGDKGEHLAGKGGGGGGHCMVTRSHSRRGNYTDEHACIVLSPPGRKREESSSDIAKEEKRGGTHSERRMLAHFQKKSTPLNSAQGRVVPTPLDVIGTNSNEGEGSVGLVMNPKINKRRTDEGTGRSNKKCSVRSTLCIPTNQLGPVTRSKSRVQALSKPI